MVPRSDDQPAPGPNDYALGTPQTSSNGGDRYETPTRRLGGMYEGRATAKDPRGRYVTARKLNLLDYYRLSKILGETASNEQAMNLATLTCAVTEIDGEQIFFPNNEREVQALMSRLDFDGLSAVTEALKMLAPPAEEDDSALSAKK
jgi:hypothetical protein